MIVTTGINEQMVEAIIYLVLFELVVGITDIFFDLFLSQFFSKGKWFKKCRIAIFGRNVIVMLKYVRKMT